jgi:hypothetical protein
MKSFSLGTSKSESISITVLTYLLPATGEFYDDNWLLCEISIQAGAFRGKFQANFLTSELSGLLQGLTKLHDELRGEYAFEPLEEQLVLKATCDSLGHFFFDCVAMDEAGIGHTLSFEISLDQTYLGATLRELSDVVRTFPVRA